MTPGSRVWLRTGGAFVCGMLVAMEANFWVLRDVRSEPAFTAGIPPECSCTDPHDGVLGKRELFVGLAAMNWAMTNPRSP